MQKTIAYSFLHYGNFSNGKVWKGKFAICEKLFLTHFLHFAYCEKFQKLVLTHFCTRANLVMATFEKETNWVDPSCVGVLFLDNWVDPGYVGTLSHIAELTLAVVWHVSTQLSWPWLCCGILHNWIGPGCVGALFHTTELTSAVLWNVLKQLSQPWLCCCMFQHNWVAPDCVVACSHTTELTLAVSGFCSLTTELILAVLGHFPAKLSWPWPCFGVFVHNWVDPGYVVACSHTIELTLAVLGTFSHMTELTMTVFGHVPTQLSWTLLWYVLTQLSWPWLCCGMFPHNWVDPSCVVACLHTTELTLCLLHIKYFSHLK